MDDLSVPILMYHSISEHTNPLFDEWAVPPGVFDEHLAFLVACGYTPITVTDLIRARTRGSTIPLRPVVLTFDDAYADFYENAYPILRRYGAPATLYVPTAWVGGTCGWLEAEGETARPMVNWGQLVEMDAGGIECGGHSHNHVQMDTLSAIAANDEIRRSKRLLEERLGHEVSSFAYPHGWTSAHIKRLIQAAGYTSACAVKNMRSAANDDPFALARLRVRGDMDVTALERLLARTVTPTEAALRDMARTVIRIAPRWRAAVERQRAGRREAPRTLTVPVDAASAGADGATSIAEFQPAMMVEIELSEPLAPLDASAREDGHRYRRALALARLHTQPLGFVEFDLGENGLDASELAQRLWVELAALINAHLEAECLPAVDGLTPDGIAVGEEPACLAPRRAFLETAPFVSVVIPTHNRPQQVVALTQSVLASEYPAGRFEVIVVDNAPSANDTALLFNQAYVDSTRVRYVREDRAGGSNARNCGLALARGEIVIFADDDELVDRHWLGEMVRGFGATGDVRCVTGLVAPMELETQAQGWFEQFGGYCKAGFASRLFNLTDHRAESPLYPFNLGVYGSGGSMAFRRDFLLGIGGFDPALGPATPSLGGEDLDAMLRVVLAGYDLAYTPMAIVRHPSHREFERLRNQLQGYGMGLSAALFKTLVTQPRQIPGFIRRLPRGVRFAFGAESPRHAGKQVDYPSELTRLEMWGLLGGPLAYLRSRRRLAAVAARERAPAYLRALSSRRMRQTRQASQAR